MAIRFILNKIDNCPIERNIFIRQSLINYIDLNLTIKHISFVFFIPICKALYYYLWDFEIMRIELDKSYTQFKDANNINKPVFTLELP